MGNDGVEDLSLISHHAVATSQNAWVKMWKNFMRDSRDRAIDEEHWCEVLHGRLIVIPDGSAEEED